MLENFFRDGNNWYMVVVNPSGQFEVFKSPYVVRLKSQQQPFACLSRFELTGELSSDGRPHFHNYTQVLLGCRLLEKRRRSSNSYTMGPKNGRRTAAVLSPFGASFRLSGRKTPTAHAKDTILCANAPGTICHFMSHMSQQFEDNNPIDYGTAYLQIGRKLCSHVNRHMHGLNARWLTVENFWRARLFWHYCTTSSTYLSRLRILGTMLYKWPVLPEAVRTFLLAKVTIRTNTALTMEVLKCFFNGTLMMGFCDQWKD